MRDLLTAAKEADCFTILLSAMEQAGLTSLLTEPGPITLFAPTDDAFNSLPNGTLQELLDKPTTTLTSVLRYHMVAGKIYADELLEDQEQSLETLDGEELLLSTEEGVMIDQAHIVRPDIECRNGILHVIDAVLVPGNS
jgi:uncharacterized surface protein with fasciclin (FAS1) repeats